jgi:alpha-D-ribose 1-methylphosphonate 5-triphosphate synthase subunit PhnH
MVAAAFPDPVMAAQSTFRAVLNATARPGTVARLEQPLSAPRPLSAGAGAIALTLCDQDTPVWLDTNLRSSPDVVEWLRFNTGARIVDNPGMATFALVTAPHALPAFDRFSLGTPEYPDRSTTIVLQVESLQRGQGFVLTGPGIRHEQHIRVTALPDDMAERLAANRRLFPRGVDLLLATETDVMALPRSVLFANGER